MGYFVHRLNFSNSSEIELKRKMSSVRREWPQPEEERLTKKADGRSEMGIVYI